MKPTRPPPKKPIQEGIPPVKRTKPKRPPPPKQLKT
jgi:hypothetical protein